MPNTARIGGLPPKLALPERVDIFDRGTWKPLETLRRDPVEAVVSLRGEGREVKIQIQTPEAVSLCPDPPRREEDDIRGFSLSARRRMRQKLAELRRDADGLFLTLTYHRSEPDGRTVKKHLHAFVQALRRRWKRNRWSLCWRLEYQKRGTPHLHFLIWGIQFEHKEWLKATWHRITEETSAEHLAVGAWVERMEANDGKKLNNYVNKYMAKPAEGTPDDWQGRLWGFRNKKHLPIAPVTKTIRLNFWQAYSLIERTLEEWNSDTENVPYSLTIWTENPNQWIMERLTVMKEAPQSTSHFAYSA